VSSMPCVPLCLFPGSLGTAHLAKLYRVLRKLVVDIFLACIY
jgi:hypothetical protein